MCFDYSTELWTLGLQCSFFGNADNKVGTKHYIHQKFIYELAKMTLEYENPDLLAHKKQKIRKILVSSKVAFETTVVRKIIFYVYILLQKIILDE